MPCAGGGKELELLVTRSEGAAARDGRLWHAEREGGAARERGACVLGDPPGGVSLHGRGSSTPNLSQGG